MYNILPLFKTHYSLGKSILTLEKPTGKPDVYPITVFDLLIENKLNTLVLVEDNISGLLQASKQCDEKNITLIFGLRIDVNEDISIKDEASLKKRAKYIVFCKNSEGYKTLIKIWSIAARQGFYYTPCMDFKTLKSLWNENLILTVPFYDSFLELNLLNSHVHVPDLDGLGKVMFLTESNDLPFDDLLSSKVNNYCQNRHNIIKAQSIFYKKQEDFEAYVAFRCIHNRGSNAKSTLDKPDLEHMSSDTFNFDRWMKLNKQTT